jgi:hypothetical protein
VRALLELLRPAAAEIVVALDDRADAAAEAEIASAADHVVRYTYRAPVDRALRWLFGRCRGEWILNLDDDEIPSAALLGELPSLLAARDVTHYWLRRRWLWPDTGRVIADDPWLTDYQLRLVRNDQRLLRFPSETHRPLEALGPHRFVRSPLFHADLVLTTTAEREAKARRYEALRPGKRAGGGPMNHVFHLPERRRPRTEALSDADAELVRGVLAAAGATAVHVEPAAVAPDADIEALWSGRELSEADRRGRIELLDPTPPLVAGEQRTVDASVENLGGAVWPWGERGEPEVRLSYQWLDAGGQVAAEGVRTALPSDLAPGEALIVPLHILAPSEAGRYRLHVDLIQEHVGWFGCAVEREVEVGRRLRVALSGDPAAVERALAELVEVAPEFEPVVLSPDPGPRFGAPRAPDLRRYLLTGTRSSRARDLGLVAARTRDLLRAARARRAGRDMRPLLRGGEEFLDELARDTHLVFLAGEVESGTLELLLQAATAASARELGVQVVVERGAVAEARDPVDRRIARSVLRGARVVEPGELSLP